MGRRALISVSDKSNVIEFAQGLLQEGFEILSTGGTLKVLQEAGVAAVAVDEITGFPEIMDGRVKTLHPNVHGGILGKRSNPEHMKQMEDNGISPIDIVVVNLYPFKATLLKEGVTEEEIIENIDIGGPAMVRSSAKNFEDVLIVVDPGDYDAVLEAIKQEDLSFSFRKGLAAKAFRHTANYDAMIAGYFTEEAFPENYTVTYEKVQDLRYGENPHQKAAFYQTTVNGAAGLAQAKQLHGKELSYNNIQDANAALEMVLEYDEPTAVAVKHTNPCGIGTGTDLAEAFKRTYEADPVSIFGGIIAVNREVDAATAEQISELFIEIVIAPAFTAEALAILTRKQNIRLLEVEMGDSKTAKYKLTSVSGGMLVQEEDVHTLTRDDIQIVTKRQPTEAELEDLLFSWKAVKHVKSNAIVLAKDKQTIGIGAGQMNRVGSAKIAIEQAGEKAKGSVLASDAFFPMPDTVEAAIEAGVSAIIQPGGSKRDQDSIDVCDKHGIAMVYTGVRHFKH